MAAFAGTDPLIVERKDSSKYEAAVCRAMVRALIGTAAFAGLRQGEIGGLGADDDLGEHLLIRRTVWHTTQKDSTKTGEDEAQPGIVPIIRPLRALLDAVKPEYGFFFLGERKAVLDLENLADRVMRPYLKAHNVQWHGWHVYRRGLATNLHQLGVDDLTIQAILRHTDVATTRRSYIKTVPQAATEAMQQLASRLDMQ